VTLNFDRVSLTIEPLISNSLSKTFPSPGQFTLWTFAHGHSPALKIPLDIYAGGGQFVSPDIFLFPVCVPAIRA